jgi:hypothetical protein
MREHQYLWTVDLPNRATIADALEMARGLAAAAVATAAARLKVDEVPWDTAPVGVFGEPRDRSDVPSNGDRIEIYRPLRSDPRQRRRELVRRDRRAKR